MAPETRCPHCDADPRDIEKLIEPLSQIPEEAAAQRLSGTRYYCQSCGKTWSQPKLPLEGPKG